MTIFNKYILIISTVFFSTQLYADISLNNADNLNFNNSFEGSISKGATSSASKVMNYSNNRLDKLEFKFSGASAWLNVKGDWHVKAAVKHNRLRCATYQIGIRFGKGGKGDNGCKNPVWVTDYEYGTNAKQCNSAELEHIGGGYFSELENKIENITCAQIDIKCFGSACSK